MGKRRATLRIRGKVQGVFFRESTRVEATRLGLTGWVRNRDDGSVEAVAEGERRHARGVHPLVPPGPPGRARDGRRALGLGRHR